MMNLLGVHRLFVIASLLPVIASEAKQSLPAGKTNEIASGLKPLAMTKELVGG